MVFVGGDLPEQSYLLPPDVRDWLPAGHLTWALLDLAGEMDLSAFTGWYRADGQGRPAYHPAMMVALACYCYCKGVRSSRAIEAATFDDLGARVICGNLHPDHSTTARFLDRHQAEVKKLVAWSVSACAREGLVSVDVVAGDGTKIRASASKAANATVAALNKQIAGLEELVDAEVAEWIAAARAEDIAQGSLPDGDSDGGGGEDGDPGMTGGTGQGRKRTAATLARRRDARDRLAAAEQARQAEADAADAERTAKLEARAANAAAIAETEAAAADAKVADYERRTAAGAGSRRGPAPVPAQASATVAAARHRAARADAKLAAAQAEPPAPLPPGKINATDPASKMMPAKNGGYGQHYNVQALAGKQQVIYAITTHPNPADTTALHPLLAAARTTLDTAGITARFGTILFDAGYASDANFTAPCEGNLHVAVTREARQTGRLHDSPPRTITLPSWQDMAAKLATEDGKALYKQRAGIIEPVFAQLFNRLGTRLNYRDTKTDLELALWAATHNMLKTIRARHRRTAAAQAT